MKNAFSPIVPLLVGVVLFLVAILACVLPYWMCWDIDESGFRVNFASGLASVATSNGEGGLSSNVGLWWSDNEVRSGGQTRCTSLSSNDCVCSHFQRFSDNLKRGINDITDGDDVDVDTDVDTDTSISLITSRSDLPTCSSSEMDSCDATRASNGIVTFTTKFTTKCDPHILATELRCGATFGDDDNDGDTDININRNGISTVRNSNSQSSECGTTKVDDCMIQFINAAKICYIIGGLLLILNLLCYALSGSRNPMQLPNWIMICMIMSVVVLLLFFIAFICANCAFRWGCDNDWDRLQGDIAYGASFYFGILAILLGILLVLMGLSSLKKAKGIRDRFMYDAYSNGPKYTTGYDYATPAYGYDPAYDANSYAAYPATNYAYGYGAEADEGYGAPAISDEQENDIVYE